MRFSTFHVNVHLFGRNSTLGRRFRSMFVHDLYIKKWTLFALTIDIIMKLIESMDKLVIKYDNLFQMSYLLFNFTAYKLNVETLTVTRKIDDVRVLTTTDLCSIILVTLDLPEVLACSFIIIWTFTFSSEMAEKKKTIQERICMHYQFCVLIIFRQIYEDEKSSSFQLLLQEIKDVSSAKIVRQRAFDSRREVKYCVENSQ